MALALGPGGEGGFCNHQRRTTVHVKRKRVAGRQQITPQRVQQSVDFGIGEVFSFGHPDTPLPTTPQKED